MNLKVIIFIVIIIVIIIIGSLIAFSVLIEVEKRQSLEQLQIQLVDVTFKGISLTHVTLDIVLDMYNPNDITATLDQASYQIWFNDNELGYGIIDQQTDIPPFESRTVKSEIDLNFNELGETIISALSEKENTWRIKGMAHYDTILGTIDIPFDIVR